MSHNNKGKDSKASLRALTRSWGAGNGSRNSSPVLCKVTWSMEWQIFPIKIQLPRGILLKGSQPTAEGALRALISAWQQQMLKSKSKVLCQNAKPCIIISLHLNKKDLYIFIFKNKLFRSDFPVFCKAFGLKIQHTPGLEQWETSMVGFSLLQNPSLSPLLPLTPLLLENIKIFI